VDGWKGECMTVASAASDCRPDEVRFACEACRVVHCDPCAKHLARACRHCGSALVTLPG
jgi:hypothetical protein